MCEVARDLLLGMILIALVTQGSCSLVSWASSFFGCTPPTVDWKETPDGHALAIEIPGFNRNEIKIEVENRVLRVSALREREEKRKVDTLKRSERCYGKIYREFHMPENVNLDSVKAKLENGVLCFYLVKYNRIVGSKVVKIEGNENANDEL